MHPLTLAEEVANRAKRIRYLVETDKFLELYVRSSPDSQQDALACIKSADEQGLKLWYKYARYTTIDKLTVRELRKLASLYGITDYYNMHKSELITELKDAESRKLRELDPRDGETINPVEVEPEEIVEEIEDRAVDELLSFTFNVY